MLAGHCHERARDLVEAPNVDDVERYIEFPRGRFELGEATSGPHMPENPGAGKPGDDLRQQTEVLAVDLGARVSTVTPDHRAVLAG